MKKVATRIDCLKLYGILSHAILVMLVIVFKIVEFILHGNHILIRNLERHFPGFACVFYEKSIQKSGILIKAE